MELVGGRAEGELMYADVGLSFWGGVCPLEGTVIDHTHPLYKQCISDKVLAIPNGRGSCTGSQVILELILNGIAPAAMVLRQPDAILSLGVLVAEEIFGKSIPIVSVGAEAFAALEQHTHASVCGNLVVAGSSTEAVAQPADQQPSTADELIAASTLALTDAERAMKDGEKGEAVAMAMRVLVRAGVIDSAPSLIEIKQAHIDGCTYIGPGGLRFAETLADLGGKVCVPTTLNSNSVDRRRWQALGVSPDLGE
jgi:predicted aconitase with swiveling domain